MGKPHVHADLIKAWADGAEIERYHEVSQSWSQTWTPLWHPKVKYRIKPQPIVFYCSLRQNVRSEGPHMYLSKGFPNKKFIKAGPGFIGTLKIVIDPDTKELVSATLENTDKEGE